MTTQPTRPIALFYSCAQNPQDQALLTQLDNHLTSLKQAGLLTTSWHTANLLAGSNTTLEPSHPLNTAHIILLLISPDYIASCHAELQRAMERFQAREVRVIPIILRPGYYEHTLFARLQALPTNGQAITTWSNPDEALAHITQEIGRVIQQLIPTSITPSSASTPPQSAWNIPYSRNPFFTGREQLLKQLRSNLTATKTAALTQAQAINGLGGIGKTQTAVEYAYRYRDQYRYILWVTATKGTIITDFVKLADLLNLPEKNAQDQTLIVAAVQQWLTQHDNWLLILDNADDISLAANFIPSTYRGHILLTTRAQSLGSLAQSIEVEKMDSTEGSLLLLRRARVLKPADKLQKAPKHDRTAAQAIVVAVDGLPLALDQAGAYIEETGCGVSTYLDRYQQRQATLLQRRGGIRSDHPDSVATTWSLSFEQVENTGPLAADLLRLCAFLAPDAIPEELFTAGASQLGPQFEPIADDSTLLDEAIAILRNFSLIRRDSQTHTLSIHRLVQAVLKDGLSTHVQKRWTENVVRALYQAFPADVDVTTWPQCRRYIPQVKICASIIDQYELNFSDAAWLLHQTGIYLYTQAQYAQAESFYRQALSINEKVLGFNHPETISVVHDLAVLYQMQGRYVEAQPLYQRALMIKEKVLPEHPDIAETLHELARLYQNQEKYAEAETLYHRSLFIKEKILGPDHPDTTTTLHQLAQLYMKQGKYAEAESLYLRALSIKEKRLESDHPSTAATLHDLAVLYHSQGKYTEVEPFYQRALAIMEKILPDHPDTATVLEHYAIFLRKMNREAEAEKLEKRASMIRTKQRP